LNDKTGDGLYNSNREETEDMGRDENVIVFENTMWLCESDPDISASVKASKKGQELILETDTVEVPEKKKYAQAAQLIVSGKRTFEAAAGYKDYKVCVHNFASATNPGGGVVRGATAQEECLCRCSGLYVCLSDEKMRREFYQPHRDAHDPLYNGDIIYTPDVLVFKSDTSKPELLPKGERYSADVITCAAPNLRTTPIRISDKKLLEIHEKRLRRILDAALVHGAEAIVLGAFGCGAFLNDPEVAARAAKTVIAEYMYAFRAIEFAVYCSPRDERNYKVFKRVICS